MHTSQMSLKSLSLSWYIILSKQTYISSVKVNLVRQNESMPISQLKYPES